MELIYRNINYKSSFLGIGMAEWYFLISLCSIALIISKWIYGSVQILFVSCLFLSVFVFFRIFLRNRPSGYMKHYFQYHLLIKGKILRK